MGIGAQGEKKTSTAKTDTQTDTDRTVTTSAQKDSAKTEESLLSSLPEELQNLLSDIIETKGQEIEAGGSERAKTLADFTTSLASRAQEAQADIFAQSQAILDESRRVGERELGALETRFAREAGGSVGNTFVTAATAEGRASLESQLAAQEAQQGIQARQLQSAEFAQVLQALSADPQGADIANFTKLLETLKGASVEQTGRTDIAETSSSELREIIKVLTESTTKAREGSVKVSGQFGKSGI